MLITTSFSITQAQVVRDFRPALISWVQESNEALTGPLLQTLTRYENFLKMALLELCPQSIQPLINQTNQALYDDIEPFLEGPKSIIDHYKLLRLVIDFIRNNTTRAMPLVRFLNSLGRLYQAILSQPDVMEAYCTLESLGGLSALELKLKGEASSPTTRDAREAFERLLAGQPRLPIPHTQAIDTNTSYGLIDAILHSTTGVWADFGTGDGQTLCALARKKPDTFFIGGEVFIEGYNGAIEREHRAGFPHLKDIPSNAQYAVARSQPFPEEYTLPIIGVDSPDPETFTGYTSSQYLESVTKALTRHMMAQAQAQTRPIHTVSIFYPYTQDVASNALFQVLMGIHMVASGGSVIILSEKPAFINTLVENLAFRASLDVVAYGDTPLSAKQLRALGITPHRFSNIDFDDQHLFPPYEPYGRVSWGYPLILRKR